MRWKFPTLVRFVVVGVVMLVVGVTAGCAGKIERVLRDHRGTDEWTQSSEAFKQIMRNYVHGHGVEISDEQLDSDFEAYLTVSQSDVDRFIEDQSCVPPAGTAPARYYMANAIHQRHDAHFATAEHHPLTGTGEGETLHATFSANMLLERHRIDARAEFPARAGEGPFPSWKSIAEALGQRENFDGLFHFVNPAQADEVFAATSAIDWSKGTGDLFIAPPLNKKGDVFSPALFAIYLLRPEPEAEVSVYLTVSANATGEPETSYVGLVDADFNRAEAYGGRTGFAFTYLSDPNNLLDYALVMNQESSLSFELWITTAFADRPESPYLTVKTAILPAVSEADVSSFTKVRAAKIIMMVRKGALMRDLIAAYYPDAPELKLWEDVNAIKTKSKFLADLESAGLTVAAGLFEGSLWLEKPRVEASGEEGQPEFENRPGMELECEGSQR